MRNHSTAAMAAFAREASFGEFPRAVKNQAIRAMVNIVGCMVGGSRHPSVEAAVRALSPFAGTPQATLLGGIRRTDALTASLANCLASCVHTFDDAHSEAVVHPTGPVASALLALSEMRSVSGCEFLAALVVGIEATCRVSKAISVAPARGSLVWSQTGLTGAVGSAVASGRLLGLDARAMVSAIAIASAHASGIRVVQGSAVSALMPAHAASAGLRAALLAQAGLVGPDDPLEGKGGLLEAFSAVPAFEALTSGLGQRFEVESLTYKPYPCGIVIGPIIDCCLALHRTKPDIGRQIEQIKICVNPVTLALTDRRHPVDALAAQVSLYHWAAFALNHGNGKPRRVERVGSAKCDVTGLPRPDPRRSKRGLVRDSGGRDGRLDRRNRSVRAGGARRRQCGSTDVG